MSNNKINDLYKKSKLQEKNSDEQPLSASQIYGSTIPTSIVSMTDEIQVEIPIGFVRQENQPIRWVTSIDKSQLELIVRSVDLVNDSYLSRASNMVTVPAYQLQLVGQLNYNVVITGFVPSVTNGVQYANNQEVSTVQFNTFGKIPINEDLGYVTDYNVIQQISLQSVNVARNDNRIVLLKRGEVIEYNPQNQEEFYQQFDGTDDIIYIIQSVFLLGISGVLNS